MRTLISIVVAVFLVLPSVAFAQATSNSSVGATQQTEAGAAAIVNMDGTQMPDPASNSAFAPSISIGNCGTGVSAGITTPVASISGGAIRMDQGCADARGVTLTRAGPTPLDQAAGNVQNCQTSESARRAYATLGRSCEEVGRETLSWLERRTPQPASASGGQVADLRGRATETSYNVEQ